MAHTGTRHTLRTSALAAGALAGALSVFSRVVAGVTGTADVTGSILGWLAAGGRGQALVLIMLIGGAIAALTTAVTRHRHAARRPRGPHSCSSCHQIGEYVSVRLLRHPNGALAVVPDGPVAAGQPIVLPTIDVQADTQRGTVFVSA